MRHLRNILRLRLDAGLSLRQIKTSLRVSLGVVQKITAQAETLSLSWEKITALEDQALSALFYPEADHHKARCHQIPDWSEVRRELSRKGMTKLLLWEEYSQQYPNRSYSYAQYCHLFAQWLKKQKRSMRQVHKAGDKLFVDYAGQTMPIVNPSTGEVDFAEIFVAVLGASNYTYAEATWSQGMADWTASHARTFEYLGGVPGMVVPDNLKSGVTRADRYEPELNASYQQLASHYGTAIVPARPRKPKDKAKAEVGVQIIERWILARLRHHTFFSLAELNAEIRALLQEVNSKPFKQLDGTRQAWFESIDKPALQPLPDYPYQYCDIKQVKVHPDYHVQYQKHNYSVPHHLVGETLELHASDQMIALYFQGKRITSHARKYHPGTSTLTHHMPKRHEKHQRWSPGRLMNWAKDIGDEVLTWVQYQLQSKPHPEQAYRVCLGLLSLSRAYTESRLNKACLIANQNSLYRLKHIKDILLSNQDTLLEESEADNTPLSQTHENIRGPESFQ